jgi:hypothetical protein
MRLSFGPRPNSKNPTNGAHEIVAQQPNHLRPVLKMRRRNPWDQFGIPPRMPFRYQPQDCWILLRVKVKMNISRFIVILFDRMLLSLTAIAR